jgi:phage terminase small subunit
MSLSEQQERFCQLIVQGKNQTEAYIEAGYKCSAEHARTAASRLSTNVNIVARVDQLRAKAAEKAVLTTAHFARRLERIAAAAEKSAITEGSETLADKSAADVARQCSMDAAKLLGLVIEKSERTTTVKSSANAFSRDELYAIARGSGQGNPAPGLGSGKPN